MIRPITRYLSILTMAVISLVIGIQPVQAQIRITMQAAAVANGVGTPLNVNLQATAVLTTNCASCSGGTTINFEGTEDGTNYKAINATLLSAATAATTTAASGINEWVIPVAGLRFIQARISAYSAGTITVTGSAVPQGGGGGGGGSGGGVVSGTVGIDQTTPGTTNGIVCNSGCSGGTQDTDDGTIAGAQVTGLSIGETYVWDGSNWKRLTIGTAGTSSTQVLTFQGIASGTPLPVTGTITAVTSLTNALPAGTNAIGKLAANSGVDIGDVDITSVVPGTGATNAGKAESGTPANGDTGDAVWCHQQATLTDTGTDGKWSAIKCGANGVLYFMPVTADAIEGLAVATTPVPVGCVNRAIGSVVTLDDGDIGYLTCSANNELVVSQFSTRANDLTGLITSAMTGTSTTALTGMGAQGANIKVYVTSCEVHNTDDTTDTEIVLQDGSGGSTLWTFSAAHNYGGVAYVFPNPIHTTANTGLFAANVTSSATTKLSCTGFRGK